MKILVTGINGSVGGNVYRYLLDIYGNYVEGISRSKYFFKKKNKNEIIYKEDFINPTKDSIFYEKYDCIIHAAAITPKSAKSQNDFITNNVISKCFLKKLNLFKGKFIHLSSASVYETSNFPLNENSTLTQKDKYGISMYESENIFKNKLSHIIIFRIFYPYGFDKFTIRDNLVDKLLNRIQNNLPLTVNSLYKNTFINPLFINDLNLIVNLFLNNKIKSDIYNLAGPNHIKFNDFLIYLHKKLNINKNKKSILINDSMPIPHSGEINKLLTLIPKESLTSFKSGLNNIKLDKL